MSTTPNVADSSAAPVDSAAAPVSKAAEAPKSAAPAAEAPKAPEAAKGAEAAPAKEPTAADIRKLKLKLDGMDIELPENEVVALAQQSAAAQKRFMEAAQLKKQVTEERARVEQALEFVKSQPAEALKRLGIDLRTFAEETLTQILSKEREEAALTPDQKKARELEAKLRAYEEKEKAAEEEAKQKAAAEAEEKARKANAEKEAAIMKKYDEMFTDALKKSGVPATPWSVARMATLMRINLKNKHELNAEQLASVVKEDYDGEFKSRMPKTEKGDYDGEKLLAMLGPDVEKAIKAAFVAKLKSPKAQKFSTPVETPVEKKTESPKRWRDFQNKNRIPRS